MGNRVTAIEEYADAKRLEELDNPGQTAIEYRSKEISYTYDAAGELTRTDEDFFEADGKPAARKETQLSYDANGNQILTTSGMYLPDNGAPDSVSLSVTEEGGAGSGGGMLMSQSRYDGFNRLVELTNAKEASQVNIKYRYNGDGLRTEKTETDSGGESKTAGYVYDGQHVAYETGTDAAAYVRGLDYIARNGAGGGTSYYYYNAHGDVVQTADEAGAVRNRYEYDVFGEAELADQTDTNPIRYSGEFYDENAGLYYLRSRYYNPSTARFTTRDTYAGDASDPRTLNRYAYCNNDPINYVDPSGHSAVGLGIGVGLAVVGMVSDAILNRSTERDQTSDGTARDNNRHSIASAISRAERQEKVKGNTRPVHPDPNVTEKINADGAAEVPEIALYNMNTGAVRYERVENAEQLEQWHQQGWGMGMETVLVYDSATGSMSRTSLSQLAQKRAGDETGTWLTGNEEVMVFDSVTGKQSYALASELAQKRAGDDSGTWLTANESVKIFDSVTGKESVAEAWEIWGKRIGDDTGTWLTANEKVAIYDSVTGYKSEAEAWEVWGKRIGDDTGKWYTAMEEVVLYDDYYGRSSVAYAYEIAQKRAGDKTGTWYTAYEEVNVYEHNLGTPSVSYAYELEGKIAGDETGKWATANMTKTVYAAGTGEASESRYYDLLEHRESQDWYVGGEMMPVYSQMQGGNVYVEASQAKAFKANDAKEFQAYMAKRSTNHDLGLEGIPNSTGLARNPDGTVHKGRTYGDAEKNGLGKARVDTDLTGNEGTHEFPHQHDWTWENGVPNRGPAHPVPGPSPYPDSQDQTQKVDMSLGAQAGLVITGVGLAAITIIEDIGTEGAGVANDAETFEMAGELIRRGLGY